MPSESTSEVQRSGHGRCAHPLEGPERGAAVVLAIGPTMVTRLVGRRREQDPLAMLSDRKRKVLGHMAQGPTNTGLADELFVSPKAVEGYVRNMFMKLDLQSGDRR